MNTTMLECGCSISYWMGGTGEVRELAGFHLCDKHLKAHKEAIRTIFAEILNENKEVKE